MIGLCTSPALVRAEGDQDMPTLTDMLCTRSTRISASTDHRRRPRSSSCSAASVSRAGWCPRRCWRRMVLALRDLRSRSSRVEEVEDGEQCRSCRPQSSAGEILLRARRRMMVQVVVVQAQRLRRWRAPWITAILPPYLLRVRRRVGRVSPASAQAILARILPLTLGDALLSTSSTRFGVRARPRS